MKYQEKLNKLHKEALQYRTSVDGEQPHDHLWGEDEEYTSADPRDGHKHRRNLETMKAELSHGHEHDLLKK